tara:strand:+ start:1518 stop:2270 length:753 start_codon:yes stop_codon:yes gene_type:complete
VSIISIIGVGPGAADLLTIRAVNKIKIADVVVWTDSLISPEIIQLVSRESELISTSSLTLEEILPIMISKTKEGKKVVRLHDGDPCLYGAINEQIKLIEKENIKVEIIPGISAYQATAAALKSELTIPEITQTIVLCRASGRTGTPERESLEKLAALKCSLCIYLSARHVKQVQKLLLKFYPPQTPLAIGYRVSWKDEWMTLTTIDQMEYISRKEKLERTTIYIVSPALNKQNTRSNLYKKSHKHIFRPN